MSAWVNVILARPDADALLDEARSWLADCDWRDVDADALLDAVDALTDADALLMVDAHYGGGLDAFASAFAVVADAPW